MSLIDDARRNVSANGSQSNTASAPTTPEAAAWPAPPDPMAYFGLGGDIVKTLEPHTESDPVALLVQLLLMFGNCCGRGPHATIEGCRHGLNEFALMVGGTASGRKGTSFSHIRKLFDQAEPAWSAERIANGLSSGEGLIHSVRDATTGPDGSATDPGEPDKRLMIVESEFASVLRQCNRPTNTLSAIIRNTWDSGMLRTMTRHNALRASDHHVSLVGHITPRELVAELNDSSLTNGLINRFLIVCVKRSKLLPRGGNVPTSDLHRMQSAVAGALDFARLIGDIGMTPGAWDLWDASYEMLTTPPIGAVEGVFSRAAPHVRRIAMIHAALNSSDAVDERHLAAALALWQYCSDSARCVFGTSTGNSLADDLLIYLKTAGELGMSKTDLMNATGRNQSASRMNAALTLLESSRLAQRKQITDTGGRPAERWFTVTEGNQ